MLGSMVDLSRLPAPTAVQPLDFELVLRDLKADLIARFPAIAPVLALESEAAVKLLEVFAYRELLLRAHVNDEVQQTMLVSALGSNLDHLAGTFGVERLTVTAATANDPAVMESDERLRRRVQLSFEAYSTAGSAGAYIFHALTATPTLVDATAVKTAPGEVTVTLLGAAATLLPSEGEIDAVRRRLSADTVRPLTDLVVVRAPTVVESAITVSLTILPGPDAEVVRAEVEAQLTAFVAENRRLGADLQRSAVFARSHVGGVHRADVIAPAADLPVDKLAAIRVTALTVTIAGRDE